MNEILPEKEFQHFITERLAENGYEVRDASNFDPVFACDRELLFRFLNDTQPETMDKLRRMYKDKLEDTIVGLINNEATKSRGSLLDVLKHGVELSYMTLHLMYTKPATTFNPALTRKYEKNVFSVMEEVWANDKERIDLVIFLNGLAIMSFELKSNAAGQSYHDAILQYRTKRDPKSRLFLFKAGTLVNFAMDLNEVYMTTKLEKNSTFFLPFNTGNGEGVNAGAGNPTFPDKYSVSYMWEDILTKDTVLDLISKFMFIESKEKTDERTGKTKLKENLIFPRYHQLDLIRKLLSDVKENRTSKNYLIQHSAGSGKTNSIAWLAHRLASLHDAEDQIIYNNVVIMTDRVVVDRQLQKAVMGLEHKSGLIKVMSDDCTSADLAKALAGNTKIIVSTIQKFPYIVNSVKGLENKKFAVIIDEAHSSTSGRDMAAVTGTLGAGLEEFEDVSEVIQDEIRRNGKQSNVSMFAFTATPKAATLQLFGQMNEKGQREAFHVYSMKQAIEEGFILDVLSNYTTYRTYYQLNKAIEDDPELKTDDAKRQIARFVELHDTNIAQRIEIVVEHFRANVMNELGGNAKAMVITGMREAAVKYYQALNAYIERKRYGDVAALVAFSGKVNLAGDKTVYTEVGMNGFPENMLTGKFDEKQYNILLVANKYQTGFDQPKLCAMYVFKKLNGVAAVQTLSRLNRIYPPYEKKVFVLDFVNSYEDIIDAFKPYYTTTLLSSTAVPKAIYDIEAKIDSYYIIEPDDVEKMNDILYGGKFPASKVKERLTFYFKRTVKVLGDRPLDEQREFVALLKGFVRYYEFLLQASCFKDVELHKKYKFISFLLPFINLRDGGGGYNLDGKLAAENFFQKKEAVYKGSEIGGDPIVPPPFPPDGGFPEEMKEQLSKIIADLNARMGKILNNDVALKAILQIRDLLLQSKKLKASAKVNSLQDFEFSYFSEIDKALAKGYSQNETLYTVLLNDKEIKRRVLGVFFPDVYRKLRGEGEENLPQPSDDKTLRAAQDKKSDGEK